MPWLQLPNAYGLARPNGPLRIAENSELAVGLRHVFLCHGWGMVDLVTGRKYASTGGSAGTGVLGPCWVSDGAARINGPTGAAAQVTGNYTVGTGVSCFIAGHWSTAANVCIAFANADTTSGQGGWGLRPEQWINTGNVGFSSRGAGSDYNSGLATPTTDGSVLSLRMTAAGTTYYRVGSSTASTANATPASTGNHIAIGSGSDGGDPCPSGTKVYWAAIYNIDVPESHRQVWHTRPFGTIIVPATPRSYFFPTGGGGGTFKSAYARGSNVVIQPGR